MLMRLGSGVGFFLGFMALGWWLRRRQVLAEARAARLVQFTVTGLVPITLCGSFWRMRLDRLEPWLLPLLGLLISASTLLPAWLYARRAGLSRPQTGAFLTCALFSNLGYLGAFSAFALFGEVGYGLCMLYLVFFTPCFYTLGFWIAGRYGTRRHDSVMGASFRDGLRLYPFAGMLLGACLSLAQVPRPAWIAWTNQLLIPLSTAVYLAAVGSQLAVESPWPWRRACGVMTGIKFLYTPLIAWGLLEAFRIHGLPRTIVLLQASTPVAVSPLVLPLLFGLDRKLTNALWLWTTAAAIPWFLALLPWLLRALSR